MLSLGPMDLVAWIVGRSDGGLGVVFAPSWSDRMPAPPSVGAAPGKTLRRKSAPLVSRWLPHPVALAELEGEPPGSAALAPAAPGAVALSLLVGLEGEGGAPTPVLPPGRGELALATVLSELVSVVGDLLEALSLPLLSLSPDKEARGFDVALGSVGALTIEKLAEHLLLFRAALDVACQARGLVVERARVRVGGANAVDLDARVGARLTETAR